MKKNRMITAMLILAFFIGLSLLLYPTVANWWNQTHQTRAIDQYSTVVKGMDKKEAERILRQARKYNSEIALSRSQENLDEKQKKKYEKMLDIDETGVMAYVEIPIIGCNLPVYHGTSEGVLQTAIGHIEWSSLPVGGKSTHCVLSGHRGLPSAELFTNIAKLAEGDTFMIHVLNNTLTYEVDQILTVEPDDTTALRIKKGKDYCTLVTCTPYGVNTHRLLVRGHRIENIDTSKISADAVEIEPVIVASVIAIILLAIALLLYLATERKRKEN